MKTALLVIACTIGSAAWSLDPNGEVPPRSFLNAPARNTTALISSLDSPRVLHTYQRHYGVSRDELEQFFRTLHLRQLGKTSRMQVYHVDHKTGLVGSGMRTLKGTELVWVSADDTPLLVARCGNPLGRRIFLPPAAEISKMTSTEIAVPQPEVVLEPAMPEPITVAVTPETAPLVPIEPATPFPTPLGPVTATISSSPIAAAFPLWALAPIPFFLLPRGGSSAPVPEPSSVATLLVATAAWHVVRRRTRS